MVLTQLSPGQSARIKNMNQLARPLRRKLMVMGLLPQTEVIYLRSRSSARGSVSPSKRVWPSK